MTEVTALQLLNSLNQYHKEFSSRRTARAMPTFFAFKESGEAIKSVSEFCETVGADVSRLRVLDFAHQLQEPLKINSGLFFGRFNELICLDSKINDLNVHGQFIDELPDIPIIVEGLNGCFNASCLDAIDANILLFDKRIPAVIFSLVQGLHAAIPAIDWGSQNPLAEVFQNIGCATENVREYANRCWEANSAILCMAQVDRPHLPLMYYHGPEQERISDEIVDLLLHFLVAHEYAHICCGHLQRKTPLDSLDLGSAMTFPIDQQLEFEADRIALTHLKLAAERRGYRFEDVFQYLAFFFCAMEIVDRIQEKPTHQLSKKSQELIKGHHPSPLQRITYLFAVAEAAIDSNRPEPMELSKARSDFEETYKEILDFSSRIAARLLTLGSILPVSIHAGKRNDRALEK